MSTAKSMAAQYLNGKRATMGQASNLGRFKSSTSNLATSTSALNHSNSSNNNNANQHKTSGIRAPSGRSAARLKSTSMTNLVADQRQHPQSPGELQPPRPSRLQRPASRNALDTIHMGMNAKYAQVQSKVLLQNIRPQQQARRGSPNESSKLVDNKLQPAAVKQQQPAGASRKLAAGGRQQVAAATTAGDKLQLQARIKQLQEELETKEFERQELSKALEGERLDKQQQLQAAKAELQDKATEHERQSEEYHQKLLEAYELADQNRRAADSVLSESRQRDEKARKRIEELEQQLAELKEFVAMKEEMAGKMSQLREQIREERERYEDKTRTLHQVFESEKIRPTMEPSSNYFKRSKALLESCESVNNLRQHHRSEQDIYGSKLSTRMQDTARSAWKASRKFANSVITGSVGGLSACRQCTARRRSSNISFDPTHNGSHTQAATAANGYCNSASPTRLANQSNEQQLMTSVVEVGSALRQPAVAGDEEPIRADQLGRPMSPAGVILEQPSAATNVAGSTTNCSNNNVSIHVDENNKLTIVTKFNSNSPQLNSQRQNESLATTNQHHQGHQHTNLAPSSSSSSCSERSRCESSSSGRGTASSEHDADGSSSASQSGDCLDMTSMSIVGGHGSGQQQQQVSSCSISSNCNNTSNDNNDKADESPQPRHESAVAPASRRHKRKSALFSASKVFSGSQVSLNKLRGFFGQVAASKKSSSIDISEHQQQRVNLQQQQRQFFQKCQATGAQNDESPEVEPSRPTSCRGRGRIEADCQTTNCPSDQLKADREESDTNERQPWQANEQQQQQQQLGQGEVDSNANSIRTTVNETPASQVEPEQQQVPIRRIDEAAASKLHQSGPIGGSAAAVVAASS